MIVETLAVGALQANCYIAGCSETSGAIVIDPGGEAQRIFQRVGDLGLDVKAIVGTHAHLDHVLGVRELKELTGAPFWLHPLEEPILDQLSAWTRMWLGSDPGPAPTVDAPLAAGESISVGQLSLEVRLVPGHSPGSVCLVDHEGQRVFVGDLLFQGSIGRSDLPGGDHSTLIESVQQQVFSLGDEFTVLPGHGPATTVGHERQHNPFFRPSGWR